MTGAHRAPGRFRAARGRAGQPDGRHSPEYVETHRGVGVGMFAVGGAGRESLAQHAAAEPDRGGRDDPDAIATAARNRPAGAK